MVMLWVTKVFNPGPQRIGRLTKNLVLPRSVPVPNLIAGGVGGFVGLFVGLMLGSLVGFDPFTAVTLGASIGGFGGVFLITAQPWQGEHVHRVAAVRTMALLSARTLMCPGSGLPAKHSDDLGTLVCPQCGRGHSSTDAITPRHEWRRRVYLGVMPVPPPITGEMAIIPGSSPTATGGR